MTLQAAREQAGLSKERLARELGVSTRTVYNWEKHKTPVSQMIVYAYAGVTGVPVEEIELDDNGFTAGYTPFPKATGRSAPPLTGRETVARVPVAA